MGVTLAVAEYLQDGSVILPSRYEYAEQPGDLDGLVQGIHNGSEVVVFVEAKHNMDSCWRKAQTQLLNAHEHWQELLKVNLQDLSDEVDDSLITGYLKLGVEEDRSKKVMFAFGFQSHLPERSSITCIQNASMLQLTTMGISLQGFGHNSNQQLKSWSIRRSQYTEELNMAYNWVMQAIKVPE